MIFYIFYVVSYLLPSLTNQNLFYFIFSLLIVSVIYFLVLTTGKKRKMSKNVIKLEYGEEMSDNEKWVGTNIMRPWFQLGVVIVLVLILLILVGKLLYGGMGYERLVNEGGEPDFWEIGNELAAYKQSQVAPMRTEAAAAPKKESMYGPPRARVSENIVGNMGVIDSARLSAILS